MKTTSDIAHLVESLRSELEAYGTLFRFLEDQRAALLSNDAERILEVSSHINEHAALLSTLRKERERQVAESSDWETGELRTLGRFIARLKHESKPLLEELFGEITRLISESKRQLDRNQMLYRRAWDLGQEMLRSIDPRTVSSETYKRDGYSRRAGVVRPMSYVKMA